jgi:hypothetical protein
MPHLHSPSLQFTLCSNTLCTSLPLRAPLEDANPLPQLELAYFIPFFFFLKKRAMTKGRRRRVCLFFDKPSINFLNFFCLHPLPTHFQKNEKHGLLSTQTVQSIQEIQFY